MTRINFLRTVVAGPRNPHENGLDLCYVGEDKNIIVMSTPAGTYPSKAYRNNLKSVRTFLDNKHKDHWKIWEFRAEGAGYSDKKFDDKVRHHPWPDHHPPPFARIPHILREMEDHLKEKKNVAVLHCKAGKGRSGTVACSYLIASKGLPKSEASEHFTKARMRSSFKVQGVSIPSQVRWLGYVEKWRETEKKYNKEDIRIEHIKIWELHDDLKISVNGYDETTEAAEPTKIKSYRKFAAKNSKESAKDPEKEEEQATNELVTTFRPKDLIVNGNDINISFEMTKWGITTSTAHVWFNAFFEKKSTFEIEWSKMDGIKGTTAKLKKGFKKLEVKWTAIEKPPIDETNTHNAPAVPSTRGDASGASTGSNAEISEKPPNVTASLNKVPPSSEVLAAPVLSDGNTWPANTNQHPNSALIPPEEKEGTVPKMGDLNVEGARNRKWWSIREIFSFTDNAEENRKGWSGVTCCTSNTERNGD